MAQTAEDSDLGELEELERWRSRRLAALTGPGGWLSVTGLVWLSPGTARFGSAPDNDLVIDRLPAHAGTISYNEAGVVGVRLVPAAGGTIDGQPSTEGTLSDGPASPTTVTIGGVSFFLIDRDGRKALRVRDRDSDRRRAFRAIPHYPADPSWRLVADWVALDEARPFEIDSIIGTSSTILVSRKAVFRRDGQDYELWPTHGTPEAPMFVLRDATSGRDTYGAGRFLIGEDRGDTVVLDFNRAYNPPCAFTDFATCPLPPPENCFRFAIEAGEKLPTFHEQRASR